MAQRIGTSLFHITKNVMKSCNIRRVYSGTNSTKSICSTYQLGKNHKFSFDPSLNKAKIPLEVVHSDAWGPLTYMYSLRYQ